MGYEAARSFDKLLLGLAAGSTLETVSEAELRQRFDSFRALVDELSSDRHANLREPGSTDVVPAALRELVGRTALMLETDANLDQQAREALLAEYQGLAPVVDRFTSELATRTAQATTRRRSELITTIVVSGVIATALMLGLVLALLFVLRQQDRLRNRTALLNETARSLADAQRIAGVGTFHWDYVADRVRWSEATGRDLWRAGRRRAIGHGVPGYAAPRRSRGSRRIRRPARPLNRRGRVNRPAASRNTGSAGQTGGSSTLPVCARSWRIPPATCSG